MKLSLRIRLIGALVGAVILIFLCSLIAARVVLGHDLIALGSSEITSEASAFGGYVASRQEQVRSLIAQEAGTDVVRRALQTHDAGNLSSELDNVAGTSGLSFLVVADANGRVIVRAHGMPGDNIASQPLVSSGLLGESVATTALLSPSMLQREGLALQVGSLSRGLALVAASPVSDQQQHTIGVLYGGILLNHYYDIVDQASRSIGGSSAMLEGDTIVSSSINTPDGTRVVDNTVAAAENVLHTGTSYVGSDDEGGVTYLARIDPIKDDQGNVIGAFWYGLPMTQISNIVKHTTNALLLWGILAVIIVSALSIPVVQTLSNLLVRHSRQIRETAKEIGVLVVGAEVSGDHVTATKQAVERSGALIDSMSRTENPPPQLDELRAINSGLEDDVSVIETLTGEISTRMQQAVDRVAELNKVAGELNQLVTGEPSA
jgi:sensor histidine kinase regulating citrate/malate metabolism